MLTYRFAIRLVGKDWRSLRQRFVHLFVFFKQKKLLFHLNRGRLVCQIVHKKCLSVVFHITTLRPFSHRRNFDHDTLIKRNVFSSCIYRGYVNYGIVHFQATDFYKTCNNWLMYQPLHVITFKISPIYWILLCKIFSDCYHSVIVITFSLTQSDHIKRHPL